ncbi:UDP-D-xylose:L-fucose alpha-1,3-D-xylosyltransferase 3-like [Patiria miniata]|uniref:Nucleotide-diphospho-sugar transferase domain-containing protein n=1 Tax=Patiria miniata TaxID=46514 RepID=A0A913Z6P0_PATMI|nr:UDP-D-xylose:L-fucose alpha-1,3-D-xylosyltransferase 3-like [Patiria miniata]
MSFKRSHTFAFTLVSGCCLLVYVVFYLELMGNHRELNDIEGLSLRSRLTVPRPAAGVSASLAGHAVIPSSNNSWSANSACTQADIERRSATVVLTTTNAGYLDVTENMLESIKRTRACPNITVIAEDEPSYQRLTQRIQSQPGLHVQRSPLVATVWKSTKLHSRDFNRLVRRRPQYILNLLKKGYDVLFLDSDNVWFKDPFKDFQESFDIAMHNQQVNIAEFCVGFAYYRPTENTLRLVTEWLRLLDKKKHPKTGEQTTMNKLISRKLIPKLKIKTLNETNYPDGKKYFRQAGWREAHSDTTVLHLSFIFGHDAKVAKLKEFGFWFI